MKERVKLQHVGHSQLWLQGSALCREAGTHSPVLGEAFSSTALKVHKLGGFSAFFWHFGAFARSGPSPGHSLTSPGRQTGGGRRCALPLSSSSQSLAGRRGQSFPLPPSSSPLGLAPLFLGEYPLGSFLSWFLGDIWLRATMEKSLCSRRPLLTSLFISSPLNITFNSFQPSTCSLSTDAEPRANRGGEGGDIPKGKH